MPDCSFAVIALWAATMPCVAQPDPDWLIDPSSFAARAELDPTGRELALGNGLVRRVWRLAPNGACIAFDNLTSGQSMLRAVRPEARIVVDGVSLEVGGLQGQPNHAYLAPEWVAQMTASPVAMRLVGHRVSEPTERLAWARARHHAPGGQWPPAGVAVRFDYEMPDLEDAEVLDELERAGRLPSGLGREAVTAAARALRGVRVAVHYELYDGIPAMCKWLTVHNDGDAEVQVDRWTTEELAVVESGGWVESRSGVPLPRPDCLHVETDYAFGGFVAENANRHVVQWRADPQYRTQVNYRREQPCLLVVEPTYGPAQRVAPGGVATSYRTFELAFDSTERERRGLAVRRLYRTVAPWVTENPLMHHLRVSDVASVRRAIDDAAAVGFEMVILSFGSGFDIEDDRAETIAQWSELAAHARASGVELGGYSLLSSRRIGGGNDIRTPAGTRPTHGNCPALTSAWGQEYFRKLYAFFEQTGFTLLEHDGPYPGDVDVTPRPPLQKGEQDSRWVQWGIAADFYRWCRGRGIYINAPDYYYLVGTSKCGMGYRETNWSLPRAQQVIHTRQNIYDGSWTKTPSMGWMFVPLSEYHGGGAAATIEPLDAHRDHYEQMLASNFGLGVQACYRGPRLFDTERTRQLVAAWVAWFKRHRDILESDLVHGRRADGRDLDWMLHVNPRLEDKGMLVVYNPLDRARTKELWVDVYYTGLRERVRIVTDGRDDRVVPLDAGRLRLEVTVPARGMRWFALRGA